MIIRGSKNEDIKLVSLREEPNLRDKAVKYAEDNWKPISKYFKEVVEEIEKRDEELPKCFVLTKKDKIIGFYTLLQQDLVKRQDLGPWIGMIHVHESERGNGLCRDILTHGRKIAGDLGYDKVYLSSNHIGLYERFGFREIGLDMFIWESPTKIYEHTTIKEYCEAEKGKIIFLNGVSSSGKTTLALALQKNFQEPYFILSQDIFRQTWGEKFWEDSPGNIYNITMSLMYKTIRLFSQQGKNVIVDHIMMNDEFLDSYNDEGTLKDAVNELKDCRVLFVHVKCDIEELKRRELKRGDREIGHGERQLEYLYPEDTYDIVIDTHKYTTEQCVHKITEALEGENTVTSFDILRKSL